MSKAWIYNHRKEYNCKQAIVDTKICQKHFYATKLSISLTKQKNTPSISNQKD